MQPEQPVSPASSTPTPPPATSPASPSPALSAPNAPVGQAVSGEAAEKAAKRIKAAAITAIVLGVLMIIAGVAMAALVEVSAGVSAIFGIVYLIFGIKLKSPSNSLPQNVSAMRVLGLAVVVNLLISLIFGNGVGFLNILLLFFLASAYQHLFKAGLITSASPLTAKAK